MIIGVVARIDLADAVELAGKIADFLMEKGVDILLDTPLAQELRRYQDNKCEVSEMDVDLIIAVGGDGTI
ncbi:MAG: NAD(+)/NADH kinase, partial [Methanobacteriaceae archaeon]